MSDIYIKKFCDPATGNVHLVAYRKGERGKLGCIFTQELAREIIHPEMMEARLSQWLRAAAERTPTTTWGDSIVYIAPNEEEMRQMGIIA